MTLFTPHHNSFFLSVSHSLSLRLVLEDEFRAGREIVSPKENTNAYGNAYGARPSQFGNGGGAAGTLSAREPWSNGASRWAPPGPPGPTAEQRADADPAGGASVAMERGGDLAEPSGAEGEPLLASLLGPSFPGHDPNGNGPPPDYYSNPLAIDVSGEEDPIGINTDPARPTAFKARVLPPLPRAPTLYDTQRGAQSLVDDLASRLSGGAFRAPPAQAPPSFSPQLPREDIASSMLGGAAAPMPPPPPLRGPPLGVAPPPLLQLPVWGQPSSGSVITSPVGPAPGSSRSRGAPAAPSYRPPIPLTIDPAGSGPSSARDPGMPWIEAQTPGQRSRLAPLSGPRGGFRLGALPETEGLPSVQQLQGDMYTGPQEYASPSQIGGVAPTDPVTPGSTGLPVMSVGRLPAFGTSSLRVPTPKDANGRLNGRQLQPGAHELL